MASRIHSTVRPLLKANAFLGRLPDAVIEGLAQRGQTRRHAKGELIFQRGDPSSCMMLVVSGSAKLIVISARAKEVVLNFIGAGQMLGEIAALDGKERAATAVALEETELFVIRARDLLPALVRSPPAMLEIVRSLCDRARTRVAVFEDLTLDMRTRFAKGLLRLAHQLGRRRKDGIHLELAVSQEELGNFLGLARANVSRQLSTLKAMNAVKIVGTRIVITDESALAAMAEKAAAE